MQISIIIPIYNAENYISQCVKSVLNQTLNNLEIICIDDGSTDDSAKVIEALQQTDSRILLLRQENKGAGAARNSGLQHALGKYVTFLDADDFYQDRDALSKMADLCERNHLSACGSFMKVILGNRERMDGVIPDAVSAARKERIVEYQDVQVDYNYTCFLLERRLLQEHQIVFPNYRRFQDPPFLVKALYHAKRFAIADTCLYCYRAPNVKQRFDREKVCDLLCGLLDNLEFARTNNLNILFEKTLERVEYEYCFTICHNSNPDDRKVLSLLEKINEIAKVKYDKESYTIRPLAMLLSGEMYHISQYKNILKQKLQVVKSICIYGAGKMASIFYNCLKEIQEDKKVKAFLVTSAEDSLKEFCGVPVKVVSEYPKDCTDLQTPVYVATGALFHKEIESCLERYGISNYELVDDVFLNSYDAGE